MKRIAIFVSGSGEAAERIVKLFNDGNRVRTELVVVDDSATDLMERIGGENLVVLHIPDSEWHQRTDEVVSLLKSNDIKLLVLDNFDKALPAEIMETTNGEMVRVSTPEQAPREIVAALEADLRKPVEEPKEKVDPDAPRTPESEWADALKIQYTPPKIPTTPPEVPEPEATTPRPSYSNPQPPYSNPQFSYTRPQSPTEPMPSTWLIWSILVTVFCCFIPGIIAIIFSSQVSSRYYAGDIEGARRSSRMAEIWIIVSFVLGVLAATLYLPLMLIGF